MRVGVEKSLTFLGGLDEATSVADGFAEVVIIIGVVGVGSEESDFARLDETIEGFLGGAAVFTEERLVIALKKTAELKESVDVVRIFLNINVTFGVGNNGDKAASDEFEEGVAGGLVGSEDGELN